jgi:hypothetical protein
MVGDRMSLGNIANYDREQYIAEASKEERSLAAGSRLVHEILNEPVVVNGEINGLKRDVHIMERFMGVYAIHPEVFDYFTRKERGHQLDEKEMLFAVPTVIEHGGLPIVDAGNWNTGKRTPEELDREAETREQIAMALFDNPPSQDFLRDYNLLSLEDSNPVNEVIGLLESVDYNKKSAVSRREYCRDKLKIFNECGVTDKVSKIQRVVGWLEAVCSEIEIYQKNTDFRQGVRQALNSEETTLADLKKMWLKGESKIVNVYIKKAKIKQNTYDAILSGSASTYKSVKQDTRFSF